VPEASTFLGAAHVCLRNVGKTYASPRGPVPALAGIDLDLGAGEFVSIVGPSGCGKSTLLKLVAGLEGLSAGEIMVDGRRIDGPPDGLGVVFQRDVLLDWRTILQNVLLSVELAGKPTAAYRERALGLLARFGLGSFEHRYPWELSGGMRQRASIARALVLEPEVLLLDEPFGALDAVTRRQMNVELQRIWSARQITTMLITHSVDEALFLADRVVVMSGRPGRILREVAVPFARPRDPSVMRSEKFHYLVDDLTQALEA
jgi:NitT/TauT family transport system ATP-binding protein